MSDMKGKIALVTGAATGIGRATAIEFARNGAAVVVSDVNTAEGLKTANLIENEGGEATFVECDVSASADVEALISQVLKKHGRLDAAHNNAGVEGARVPLIDLTEEQWDAVMAVNLKGVWMCMKHEIPQMLEQGGGAIVNTSSVAGLMGMKGSTAYGTAKHGVIGLTKTAALEYADRGVRVNAICPGAVRTPMTERLMGNDPEREAMYMSIQPIGRFGTTAEIANLVVWLCSDAASLVTGTAIPIDGGVMAG
ncbi:MAG: SDR family oxidoreductase [Chloroflexi bacterium]|nr:SDR family oxidoreductase [Chloroflexota bacterium]